MITWDISILVTCERDTTQESIRNVLYIQMKTHKKQNSVSDPSVIPFLGSNCFNEQSINQFYLCCCDELIGMFC